MPWGEVKWVLRLPKVSLKKWAWQSEQEWEAETPGDKWLTQEYREQLCELETEHRLSR